ncbi:MAG: hypothetical protein ACRED1_05990 [Limisphaerales bacterium]
MNGFYTITVGGVSFATTDEIVSFQAAKSSDEFMEIVGYGAESKVIVALGNLQAQGVIMMTKYHATAEEAFAWFMTAPGSFNGVNDLLVSKQCGDGTTVSWLDSGAKVVVSVEEPLNFCTTTRLEFAGGVPALQP